MEKAGGAVSRRDLTDYRVAERADPRPLSRLGRSSARRRRHPAMHITQMLNILEGFDVAGLGFRHAGQRPSAGRGAEDRLRRPRRGERRSGFCRRAGRPITSKGLCRRAPRRGSTSPAPKAGPAAFWPRGRRHHASHRRRRQGNVITTTQTINSLFGARFIIPGTGMVPNDPCRTSIPGRAMRLSIAPGKRVTTSMSPMMARAAVASVYALGLPGGRKIFPSAFQALINLIDHGMTLQEAVEAPRGVDGGRCSRSSRRRTGARRTRRARSQGPGKCRRWRAA